MSAVLISPFRFAVLEPRFDTIPNPFPIVENAGETALTITGIDKGRDDGPPLLLVAKSSNSLLILDPTIERDGESPNATLRFRPLPDASGEATVTVRAVNAGANGLFGDEDDGSL